MLKIMQGAISLNTQCYRILFQEHRNPFNQVAPHLYAGLHHYILIRWAKIEMTATLVVTQDRMELAHSHTAHRNTKQFEHF